MSRKVYEGDNFIWEYSNAIQPSEQKRLHEEYGIGDIRFEVVIPYCEYPVQLLNDKEVSKLKTCYITRDILVLTIKDIPKLKKIIDNCKNYHITKEFEKSYTNNFSDDFHIQVINTFSMYKAITSSCKDYYLFKMIETYIDYMKIKYVRNQQEEFNFVGNYY